MLTISIIASGIWLVGYLIARLFSMGKGDPLVRLVNRCALVPLVCWGWVIFQSWPASGPAPTPPPSPAPPARTGQRLCLSLGVLASMAQQAAQHAEPIDKRILDLGGINWVERFDFDPELKDLILVGQADPARPAMSLDDLTTAMRCAFVPGAGPPCCSLDPFPEYVKMTEEISREDAPIDDPKAMAEFVARVQLAAGPQQVVVRGVDPASPWAAAMIEADYHMKAVSQGLFEVPGVESTVMMRLRKSIERAKKGLPADPSPPSRARMWFELAQGDPVFRESDDAFLLDRCRVTLRPRKMIAGPDGTLTDAPPGERNDPIDDEFAASFTTNFALAASQERSYMRLENNYRMLALAKELASTRWSNRLASMGFDLEFFTVVCPLLSPRKPRYVLPGLANALIDSVSTRDGDRQSTIYLGTWVSGGVSMQVRVDPAQVHSDSRVQSELLAARASRPSPEALVWVVPD